MGPGRYRSSVQEIGTLVAAEQSVVLHWRRGKKAVASSIDALGLLA